jgi:hypothetical protein
MLSITERHAFYRDPLGFAQARIDVQAFSEAMMPALAIEIVCCSITCISRLVCMTNRFYLGE